MLFLSYHINKELRRNSWLQGVQCDPIISHLFFADYSFLFFKSSIKESTTIKKVLEDYELIFGQAINFQKSEIFFIPNVDASVKQSISSSLSVFSLLD